MTVLRSERFAAMLLVVAAALGLVIANSPLAPAAFAVEAFHLGVPGFGLDLSVGHWIQDGLLAIFFFIVAVELKRELAIGELNSLSKAALPAVAALGYEDSASRLNERHLYRHTRSNEYRGPVISISMSKVPSVFR